MSKKKELKELRRRVARLEGELAVLRRQQGSTTWTLPGVPSQLDRQWWQKPWICGSGSSASTFKTMTFN